MSQLLRVYHDLIDSAIITDKFPNSVIGNDPTRCNQCLDHSKQLSWSELWSWYRSVSTIVSKFPISNRNHVLIFQYSYWILIIFSNLRNSIVFNRINLMNFNLIWNFFFSNFVEQESVLQYIGNPQRPASRLW